MKYLTLLIFLCASFITIAEQKIDGAQSNQPPLFPIELVEKFPKAQQTFNEVKQRLLKHYYSNLITEDTLYYAAIQGMLRHISPPENKDLAQIWSPKQYQTFNNISQGVQTAIGVQLKINKDNTSLSITHVSPNSPADGKLQIYDRILRINGKKISGKNLLQINNLLSGPSGSTIKFTIVRDIKVFDTEITSQQFNVKNVIVKIQNQLAYITINKVTAHTSIKIQEILIQLEKEGVKELIIDLRNNGGGDFFQGIRMAETLLEKDKIILRILQKKQQIQNYVSTNPNPINFKIIILVNKNTASAAEIFTIALRDHQKAKLVGTRTHGKASVEGVYSLKNGYYTKFIIAAMYSPRGQSWHSKGLLPDYFIEIDTKQVNNLRKLPFKQQLQTDLQLATAWNLLKEK